MRHAKLIHSFNDKTLKFIENWNQGHYNVKGFDYAISDIKEIYLIKFFINDYEITKKDYEEIDSIIKEADFKISDVKLTLKSYKKIDYLFRNYIQCIDSISKKFDIDYKKLLVDFKKKYENAKKDEPSLISYDIVSTPSFKTSFMGNNYNQLLE